VHVELVIRGESAGFYKALLRACGVGTAREREWTGSNLLRKSEAMGALRPSVGGVP
jgi:hypothetical protein